ncbi:MAG: hypothetical protein ACR2FJ_10145 [Qipengyuania sp.]
MTRWVSPLHPVAEEAVAGFAELSEVHIDTSVANPNRGSAHNPYEMNRLFAAFNVRDCLAQFCEVPTSYKVSALILSKRKRVIRKIIVVVLNV